MSGKIFQISCTCGVHGAVRVGSTMMDDTVNITLFSAGIESIEKYTYYTIDDNLVIRQLVSEDQFIPITPRLITDERMSRFLEGSSKLECPNCNDNWEIIMTTRFS